MVIFPLAPDQTIAQMWSSGARGRTPVHTSPPFWLPFWYCGWGWCVAGCSVIEQLKVLLLIRLCLGWLHATTHRLSFRQTRHGSFPHQPQRRHQLRYTGAYSTWLDSRDGTWYIKYTTIQS